MKKTNRNRDALREVTRILEQRDAELSVINSVQRGLAANMEMKEIYELVGDRIRDVFDAQTITICTIDHDQGIEYFQYLFENGQRIYPDPRPLDKTREKLIETKELILINENLSQKVEEYFGIKPEAVSGTELPKSVIFVPMVVNEDVIGYVRLQHLERENAFSDTDVRLLSTLANSMSVALENARLFNETTRLLAETKQRAADLDTVNRISRALASQLEFDALIDLVGEQMRETFDADIVYLALHDRETDMLHFPYYFGDASESRPFGNGITEKIILSQKPLLINHDQAEAYDALQAEKRGKWVSSYLGVPIIAGSVAIGVISVQSTEEENKFDENDQRLLTTIAANVGIAMQNAEAHQNLQEAHTELKAAQEQLVQQEKLASLGQLTAGIAHEIKNPLNFVNNFSDVSIELIQEIRELLSSNRLSEEVEDLLDDVEANLGKILEHGQRADGIVKSMLLHSRGKSEERIPTDLNNLIDEYVKLAYHGMRAVNKSFNIDIRTDFDESIEVIDLVAQDLSRAVLNIVNNAMYAAYNHAKTQEGREPYIEVKTQKGQRSGNSYKRQRTGDP